MRLGEAQAVDETSVDETSVDQAPIDETLLEEARAQTAGLLFAGLNSAKELHSMLTLLARHPSLQVYEAGRRK